MARVDWGNPVILETKAVALVADKDGAHRVKPVFETLRKDSRIG